MRASGRPHSGWPGPDLLSWPYMDLPVEWNAALTHEPTARHLDGLVAEHVMGWRRPTRPYQAWDRRPDVPGVMLCRQGELPHFCADIAAAWQVVEKLRERFTVDITVENTVARVRIFTGDRYDLLPGAMRDLARVEAPTAPFAICLAALQTVQAGDIPASEPGVPDNVAQVHELIARVDHAMRLEQENRARDDPAIP